VVFLTLLLAALAFLLGSFPARNSDVWMSLANGRFLTQGQYSRLTSTPLGNASQVSRTWLYDLLCYGLYSTFGGMGLVVCKAGVAVALALLLLRSSPAGQAWFLSAVCTVLALLAMSSRLLLQPATISYFFLALAFWFLRERAEPSGDRRLSYLPPWPLLILFVVWVNMDPWFVLGLASVSLVGLGHALDGAHQGTAATEERPSTFSQLVRLLVSVSVLAMVCLLNPSVLAAVHQRAWSHLFDFAVPPDLGWFGQSAMSATQLTTKEVTSPFQWAYYTNLGLTPAGLAYFPLAGLSLLSFFLNLARWHWRRFLPWLGLAVVSALQVRTVPFFAVAAGPVLAWNLAEFFARRSESLGQESAWRRSLVLGRILAIELILILPLLAWPGWLQSPPYEPRRWAIEIPVSLENSAATTARWLDQGKLGPHPRGLHVSQETADTFAWFCPQENSLRVDQLESVQLSDPEAPDERRERLRIAGITYIVVHHPDRGHLLATLDRMFAEPEEWPLLYTEGDVSVFGWRDPAATATPDPYRQWQLDPNGLAFHPAENERAPRKPPDREPEAREWWEAFWKPAPPRPLERDAAFLHLSHAQALGRILPARHLEDWEASQSASLVGAAAGWSGPASVFDARMRLTLVRLIVPEQERTLEKLPSPDVLARTLRDRYLQQQDDVPPALLYLAVRAARRALAANPDDARAYLILGESYLRLLHGTRERVWSKQLPELRQLRYAQASAAFRQAVALKPDYAQAHFNLAALYRELGCLDLAIEHTRTHLQLLRDQGPPEGVDRESFREQVDFAQTDLDRLAEDVARRRDELATESAGLGVLGRAFLAYRKGLKGKALEELLKSDIAAFGDQGLRLELELLLQTGRARDVHAWTDAEHKAKLGESSYHMMRAQALAASGDYEAAEWECEVLAQSLQFLDTGMGRAPIRQLMPLLVGQAVLDLNRHAFSEVEFRKRLLPLAQNLRREADVIVFRGLLALEEGEVDEARDAFREALRLWGDENAAATGSGLDFNGRSLAQGYLELLK
jgi:tetratricopeptide (TPR) repeat protein